MEKKMILTTGVNENENIDFTELISKIGAWASEPVRLLGEYYSSVLERKLSIGQTWRLIEVQLAFFACIFPADLSVAVRLLAVAWLGSAVTRCRKAMKKSYHGKHLIYFQFHKMTKRRQTSSVRLPPFFSLSFQPKSTVWGG